jgi:hypothetical protein
MTGNHIPKDVIQAQGGMLQELDSVLATRLIHNEDCSQRGQGVSMFSQIRYMWLTGTHRMTLRLGRLRLISRTTRNFSHTSDTTPTKRHWRSSTRFATTSAESYPVRSLRQSKMVYAMPSCASSITSMGPTKRTCSSGRRSAASSGFILFLRQYPDAGTQVYRCRTLVQH